LILLRRRILFIALNLVSCLIIAAMGGSNALSQNRRTDNKYNKAKNLTKHQRLNASKERVALLKKRGHMPKVLEEAKKTVEIAEEEFGKGNLVVLRPLLTLAGFQGDQKLFEEAEKTVNKIYSIVDSEETATKIYAIGFRIMIARLYIQWNMFDKAESTLMITQIIIQESKSDSVIDSRYRFTSHYSDRFTESINTELEKIYVLKEANLYKVKKKK